MPVAKTTADLITDVRSRVAAPSTDSLVSDTEILSCGDQAHRTRIAAILIATKSEYWQSSYTIAITAGTAAYRMPGRALGMTLRRLTAYDTTGREWPLFPVTGEDRWQFSGPSGEPAHYTVEDDNVVLLPTPSTTINTLRMRYYAAPSVLDLVANCAPIVRALTTTTMETTTTPSEMVVADSGRYVDIIRGAGMFGRLYEDRLMTAFSAGGVTLNAATPIVVADIADMQGLTGGKRDYLCRAGYTVFPPIPDTLWPSLVAATASLYAESIGDARAQAAAEATYERESATATSMLTPRIDGDPPTVVGRDTVLRGGGHRRASFGVR